MATKAVGGTALERLQNYKEPTIKRVTKAQQTKIDAVTLKHEGAVEQSTALRTLSDLVSNFTSAAAVLQRPYDSPFDKKSATLTTTDVGIAEKYISVTPGKYTPKMAFDVRVEQIAQASTLLMNAAMIPYNPAQDTAGAMKGGGPANLDGTFTFDVEGVAVNINVVGVDSIKDIIRKVNNEFSTQNVNARASFVKLVGGGAHIQITHQELGNKQIQSSFTDADPLVGVVPQYTADSADLGTSGQNAIIHINGVRLEQNNNIFDGATVGIEGITIKALAPNTAGPANKQTATIVPDISNENGVVKDLDNFVTAYNDLAIFVAKMTEKASDEEYASTAVLHNSQAINQARFLLSSVFDPSINSGGKYKLLSDIGIGLKVAEKSDNAPARTKLLGKTDETKLRDALTNNYEDFTALFVGKLKVTNSVTRGSKLDLSMMTEPLESKFYNTPMRVKINPGAAAGQVAPFPTIPALDNNSNPIFDPDPNGGPAIARMISWDVEVEIDGITNPDPLLPNNHNHIRGHYTRNGADTFGYIDFKDTDLKGLRLQWDAVNVVGGVPEVFTVNLSQGLADLAYFRSNDLMSEDGNRGTLILTSKEIQQKVKDLSAEQTKLETILEKELDKIEQQFAKIEQMSILNDIFLDAISDLLNPAN
jgi:flagellar capping protein FliD